MVQTDYNKSRVLHLLYQTTSGATRGTKGNKTHKVELVLDIDVTVVTERLSDPSVQNLQLSLNGTLHSERSEETFSNLTANTESRSVCFFTLSLKLILSEQNAVADKVATSRAWLLWRFFFLFFIFARKLFCKS